MAATKENFRHQEEDFFLETIGAIHVHIVTVVVIWTLGWAIFISLLTSERFWPIAVVYLVWWAYDRQTPYREGRRTLANWSFFRQTANYYPIKLHKTVDLDPSKNYLFAFHPHGILTVGCYINFATDATGFSALFPGIKPHMLSINAFFMSPFCRDYALCSGIESISADAIDYKLNRLGPGHSVSVVVGGGQESMMADHSVYTFKILRRYGFIRRALKNRALLVPVISFNEHRPFEVPRPSAGSLHDYFYRFMKRVGWIAMSANNSLPLVFYGRWPLLGRIVPRQLPINTVIGEPIDLMKMKFYCNQKLLRHHDNDEPTQQLIDECHEAYLEALRKLYDANKARFGDENTPLIFV